MKTYEPLIGLTGYAYSGKDTAAQGLLAPPFNWRRFAFADALRALAADIGWDGEKDEFGRNFLQTLGNKARQHIREDVWLLPFGELMATPHPTIVTDVRYRNEADYIRACGGVIARIYRPGNEPVNDHVSETDMDGYSVDATFCNNKTPLDLQVNLRNFVRGWFPDAKE